MRWMLYAASNFSTEEFIKYFSVEGIDVVAQAYLLTIGWPNFVRCVDFNRWDRAVLDYGILCSMLHVGRILTTSTMRAMLMIDRGNNVLKSNSSLKVETQQVTSLGIMSVCFILLGLTNRFSWLLLCYFAIGCSGSQLVGLTSSQFSHLGDDFDMHQTLSKTLFFTGGGGGVLEGMSSGNNLSRWNGYREKPTSGELNRRAIICFLSASIISAVLFSDDVTDLKPSFTAFGSISLLCLLLASLRVTENENICHRRHSTFGRFVTGCMRFFRISCGIVWKFASSYVGRVTTHAADDDDYEAGEALLSSGHNLDGPNAHRSNNGREVTNAFTHLTGGESADLSPYTGHLPAAFLSMCKGNEEKARVAYARTLLWRQQNRVDEVLSLPQPTFYQILELFPHAIHGRSREGAVVVYEKLGQAKPVQLRDQDISPENLVEHFIMRNEFVRQRMPASGEGGVESVRLMSVLDVAGISIGDITTDVLKFLRISGQVVDTHYPDLVVRLVICNAPSWFWTIWGMIAQVLPESTRNSIIIMGDAQGLDQYIDPTQRPVEYGGTDVPLGQAPEFVQFCEIARDWERQGYEMFLTVAESQHQSRRRRSSVSKGDKGTGERSRRASIEHAKRNGDWNSDSDSSDSAEWELVDEEDQDQYDILDDAAAATAAAINTSAGAGGISIYEWVRSQFQKPNQAYLGDKNCFRYDEELGQWRQTSPATPQRTAESFRSRARSGSDTPASGAYRSPAYGASPRETLEEHGLVLAIQAAHMANMGAVPSDAQESKSADEQAKPRPDPINLDSAVFPDDDFGGGGSANELDNEYTRTALVLLAAAHVISTGIASGLPVMLPVMFLTTRKAGGFGFCTMELGICLSVSAVFALQYHQFFRWRARRLAQVSPVRALRMGAVVLTISLMALSVVGSFRALKPIISSSQSQNHGGQEDEEDKREEGMLADMDRVVVPGFILAVAAVSAHYLRQATACLLQVSLDQVLELDANSASNSVSTREKTTSTLLQGCRRYLSLAHLTPRVGLLAESFGPVGTAVVMGIVHRASLAYPMNAGFVVPFSACCAFGIYLMSFLFSLRFKTDFGDVEVNLEYSHTATGQKDGKDE